MTTSSPSDHDLLLDSLIERYRGEGYEVSREPDANLIPFDLGGYRPDLVAKKAGQGLIIEVRPQTERISFDRLRTVAGEVKRHAGWQFLLVTRQDAEDVSLPGTAEDSFAWEEASAALRAAEFAESRETRLAAFMLLWVVFERMMRHQARLIALPVDRLISPLPIIGQLYSHGELSAENFEIAKALVRVRNLVFHGLPSPDLGEALGRLAGLVRSLRDEWSAECASGAPGAAK